MTAKVVSREAYYDDEIFAISAVPDPEQAVAAFKAEMADDRRQGLTRRTPPRKGEKILVRDRHEGATEPTDWYEVKVP